MLSLYISVAGQFFVSLGVQMLVWRALRGKEDIVPKQILWLFGIFMGGPLIHFAFHNSLSQLILAMGLACTYIMSFPAAAAKSPSLLVIDALDRNGPLTKRELEAVLNANTNLVEDRMRDLKADGLIAKGQAFKPSLTGRILGLVFWYYRRLLGIPLGEG